MREMGSESGGTDWSTVCVFWLVVLAVVFLYLRFAPRKDS